MFQEACERMTYMLDNYVLYIAYVQIFQALMSPLYLTHSLPFILPEQTFKAI